MVALDDGEARTNVVRLYSIVSLPQDGPLDEKENFEKLMQLYQKNFTEVFGRYGLDLVDPKWGEKIPYSNKIRPTTALQMWDTCLLYTSPSPRDATLSRMPSSA